MVVDQDSDNENEKTLKSVYILKAEPRGFAKELIRRLKTVGRGLKLTIMTDFSLEHIEVPVKMGRAQKE